MSRLSDALFALVKVSPQYRNLQRALSSVDVAHTLAISQNHAAKGKTVIAERGGDDFHIEHIVEDGIERITYTPHQRRYETPILMMHGMWHGAWCWQQWQARFAGLGWQSVAFSLPGHGRSLRQKSTQESTLDYYLSFLRDEAVRLSPAPVLMGHSMGGALTQWYLRYVRDDLPAVVLVASWVHGEAQREGFSLFLKHDPVGLLLLIPASGDATPLIRSPKRAARLLISKQCVYSPEALHQQLSPESSVVMFQQSPPHWTPPAHVRAPMLVLGGEGDAVLSVESVRRTAQHYGADVLIFPDAAHNLMMDAHHIAIAEQVAEWLAARDIK